MKKLLLTSAGIVPEIRNEFLALLTKSPAETKVAFVITAACGSSEKPVWMFKDRELLLAWGIKQILDLDLKGKTKNELESILIDADVIFVTGGSAFYLLKYVRESGFDEIVLSHVKKGTVYAGSSAGSYLVCPSMDAALWKKPNRNQWGVTDFTGLKLVPFLIMAHFQEGYRKTIEDVAKHIMRPIVAINDQQAILVKGDKVKIIGKGKKEFWNNFKEI